MSGRFSFLLLGSALLLAGGVGDRSEGEYFPPPEPEISWRKNTDPEFIRSLGLDPQALEEFGKFNLAVPNTSWRPYGDHKGTLVIKDGWIVGEWYNSAEAKDFRTYLSSNGKAVAMMAFGILLHDSLTGRIENAPDVDSKVYDARWLKEGFPLSDPRKKSITFEQIFQHTSGLCPEKTARGKAVEQGRNEWTNYVDWVLGHDENWPQTQPLYFEPGRVEQYAGKDLFGQYAYAYSSIGFCHLGLILSNIYQMPAHQFLWTRLLEPIGFSGVDYHAPPSDSIRWFSAGGLRMTPRDYARFAYLLLRDGRWQGAEIVPAEWVQRFRYSARYPNIRSNVDEVFGHEYPRDMFKIAGSGLNWAFIVPSLDLIVLRTGRADNRIWDRVEREFLTRMFDLVLTN